MQPSRVTAKTRNLIDNIYVNDLSSFSPGGNLTTSISDHFGQFAQIDIFQSAQREQKCKFGRNWRIFNKNEFKEELEKSSWDNVTSPYVDTNTSVSNFYLKIEKLLDEMAPVKRLTKKELGLKQPPWITPDIMSSIKEGNKLYKAFIEEKNPDSKIDKYNTYKAKRNLITSNLRKAKRKCRCLFEENKK